MGKLGKKISPTSTNHGGCIDIVNFNSFCYKCYTPQKTVDGEPHGSVVAYALIYDEATVPAGPSFDVWIVYCSVFPFSLCPSSCPADFKFKLLMSQNSMI